MRRLICLSVTAATLLVTLSGMGCNHGKDPDNPKLVGPADTSVQPMGAGAGRSKAPPPPQNSAGNKNVAQ
jgi:hypothetical protein